MLFSIKRGRKKKYIRGVGVRQVLKNGVRKNAEISELSVLSINKRSVTKYVRDGLC